MRIRLAASAVLVGSLALSFPVAAQDVYRLSERVTAPKPTSSSPPKYTPEAMAKRLSGVVELEIDILADGTVGTVALVKTTGDDGLQESAVQSVKSWRFTPGTIDGKPVAVRIPVTVTFDRR